MAVHHFKVSVKGLLIGASTLLFAAILLLFWLDLRSNQLQEHNAATVNLAGRQRMLSQMMVKEFLLFAESKEPTNLEFLQNAVRLFQESQQALLTGGSAPRDLRGNANQRIQVGRPSPAIKSQLDRMETLWQPLYAQLTQLTPRSGDLTAIRPLLLKSSQAILAEMDQTVFMIASESEKNQAELNRFTTIILTLALAILGLMIWQSRRLTGQIGSVRHHLQRLAQGDLTVRLPIQGRPNEIDAIAKEINQMAGRFSEIARLMLMETETLGACIGELHDAKEMLADDSHQGLLSAEAIVRDNNHSLTNITFIKYAAEDNLSHISAVSGATAQLSDNFREIATSVRQTAAGITTMAAAAEEMTANIQGVNTSLNQVNDSVGTVTTAVEEMNLSLSAVRQRCQSAADDSKQAEQHAHATRQVMEKLSISAREINQVVHLINNIAEQTNMLALNASIEAAGAGEAGKGFAVVANEVKELARQTSEATRMISQKIDAIQTNTTEAAQAVGQIVATIERINSANNEITQAVAEQAHTTNAIAHSMEEVQNAAAEVTRNASELNSAAAEVARSAGESAIGTEEISRAATEVAQTAQNLSARAQEVEDKSRLILSATGEADSAVHHAQESIEKTSRRITLMDGATHHTALLVNVVRHTGDLLQQAGTPLAIGEAPFPIGTIKRAHLKWLGKLENVIRGRSMLNPKEVASGHDCDFGKWYDKEGVSRYGHLDTFQKLGKVHMQVHETAREIVTLVHQGAKEAAITHMDRFDTIRAQLFDLLDQLYVEASQQAQTVSKPEPPLHTRVTVTTSLTHAAAPASHKAHLLPTVAPLPEKVG